MPYPEVNKRLDLKMNMAASRTTQRPGFIAQLLRLAISILFAGWIALWFLSPLKAWENPWMTLIEKTTTSAFGVAGPVNLLFSAPIFLIVILGCIYLHISRNQQITKSKVRKRTVNLWTYPIFIGGPLGTVTAGEILILLIFLGLVIWTLSFYIVNGLAGVNHMTLKPGVKLWQRKLGITAGYLGTVGALCLAFLFFPITRGSVLLQLLNVSFEISVKYHIWIANVAMALLTAHGMGYLVIWQSKHNLQEKMSTWTRIGNSHIAGEISLLAGLIIWLTSIKPIRQRFFEVFYYTHHLYIVFIVFFALHVGDDVFSLTLPGIFLFLLDRYLRLLQSQRTVHVISARKLPSNIVQLVIAKHPSLVYKPMSIILLKLPFISQLEWHPFSIVSTSSVASDRLSILIKCQQGWTKKLDNFMDALSSMESPLHLLAADAAVEGPYGPPSMDFLRYDALILIGGGSGIAPLMSILSETLHQHDIKEGNHVPREVLLIWSVKSTEELCILNLVSPSMICPSYSEVLQLDVQAYVTQTEALDVEMAKLETERMELPTETFFMKEPSPPGGCLHSITSTNNTLWQAAIVVSAFAGYLLMTALLNQFYIYPLDHNSYEEYPTWARGFLTLACMCVGIVIFGGLVYVIWVVMKTTAVNESREKIYEMEDAHNVQEQEEDTLLARSNIHYGQRPDLQDIIGKFAMKMDGKKIGVIACGPESMQHSVGTACRRFSSLLGLRSSVALDYHSISYNF
ncbi:hypothetical protein SUGI_0140800 [Cryptomeria japonica]|uniref:probable ferric reduction oxidase 1 isoform X2 n=1 Tax=Cryptomeria japonica TaxID=3369 RepID=UPI002408EBD8|nr:probable ferric reduction oxidase 1 isoform X2 [Cryptomeria japonica]GLJ11029.1 hypothetical protein SUGI_0140800 [Cryptomeria japonica]